MEGVAGKAVQQAIQLEASSNDNVCWRRLELSASNVKRFCLYNLPVADSDDLPSLAELAEPLRRRLYEHVVSRGTAVSRDEAAGALGIGRSLAAYHLDRLLAAGLLTASYARTSGRSGPGAGRTAKLYAASCREFQATEPSRDYEQIAHLLATGIDGDTTGTARGLAEESAYEHGRMTGDAAMGRPVLDLLRERGYRPVSGEGLIRFLNCPFGRLAQGHRELVCGINHALIRGLLDGLGTGELTAALDPQPGHCCVTLRQR
jgi:predicted ArsR family transcriptional regulator